MNNFKFRLQKVLDIRLKDEEDIKIEYAKAQGQKNIVQSELNQLKADYDKHFSITEIDDIVAQKVRFNYLVNLDSSIKIKNEELDTKIKAVTNIRKNLIQKQIERKSLEILKEDKLISYQKEKESKEQMENDEYALFSHFRNKEKII